MTDGVALGEDKSCCLLECSRAFNRRLAILDVRRVSSTSGRLTKLVMDAVELVDSDVVSLELLIERLRFLFVGETVARLLFVSLVGLGLSLLVVVFVVLRNSFSFSCVLDTNDAAAICANCCRMAIFG